MSVTAAGATGYKWYRGTTVLTNNSNYSGATSATLTISAATTTLTGSYTCTATNSTCSVSSNPAILTVNGPQITVQPITHGTCRFPATLAVVPYCMDNPSGCPYGLTPKS